VDDEPQLPRFGVPDWIERSDVPFVITAGVGISMVLGTALSMLLAALGADPDEGFPMEEFIVISTLAAGPAAAYHLGRRLRSVGVSRVYGCAFLVAWTVALLVMGAFAGWLGAGLATAAAIVLVARLRPRR
jgi:hypothetical protein